MLADQLNIGADRLSMLTEHEEEVMGENVLILAEVRRVALLLE